MVVFIDYWHARNFPFNCSIDRVFPLYRSLKKQRVIRHDGFMKRQRVFGITKLKDEEVNLEKVKATFKETSLSYS